MKFKLDPADHERLGLPEVLEWDWDVMSVADARLIRKTTGVNAMALGRLWDDRDDDAVCAIVWMSARRAGVELDYPSLDFNLYGLRAVEDVADEVGKDAAPTGETSKPTPTRMRRSSATSATSTPETSPA